MAVVSQLAVKTFLPLIAPTQQALPGMYVKEFAWGNENYTFGWVYQAKHIEG